MNRLLLLAALTGCGTERDDGVPDMCGDTECVPCEYANACSPQCVTFPVPGQVECTISVTTLQGTSQVQCDFATVDGENGCCFDYSSNGGNHIGGWFVCEAQ